MNFWKKTTIVFKNHMTNSEKIDDKNILKGHLTKTKLAKI